MTFDPMSVEVTCVTLPKDHCVQVPWQYINVCGYSDQFCKLPHTCTYYVHTTYYGHTTCSTTYRMSDHIVQRFSRAGPRGRGREWATLGVHPLSWLLSNNRLEEVCSTLTKGTFSSRLLLSNQVKGCSPSVAHSLPLPLPLGPALLNLSNLLLNSVQARQKWRVRNSKKYTSRFLWPATYIWCSTAEVTASWSTVEGTLRVHCNYCEQG